MSGEAPARVAAAPLERSVEARPVVDGSARDPARANEDARGWSRRPEPESARVAPPCHSFGQARIHPSATQTAPLRVARPDDPCEIEAERIATAVLGDARSGAIRAAAATPAARHDLRAQGLPGRTPQAPSVLPQQMAAARVEGRPLADEQRGFFEQRFGHDFGAVRIHAGPASAAAAASVRAQAFTHGQDIYFGSAYHRPDTAAGRHLMAHELAHTLQSQPGVIARQPTEDAAAIEARPLDIAVRDMSFRHADEEEDAVLFMRLPSDTSGQARRRVNAANPRARRRAAAMQVTREAAEPASQPGAIRAASMTEPATPPGPGQDRRRREPEPGSPEARALRSAAAAAPPSVPTAQPAPSVADIAPSARPRTPPSVTRESPPVREPGRACVTPTESRPEAVQAGPARVEGEGEARASATQTSRTAGRADARGGTPAGGGPSGAVGANGDDDRPLQLTDLFRESLAQPETGQQSATGDAADARTATDLAMPDRRPDGAAAADATESRATVELDGAEAASAGPRSGETAAAMEGFAAQLETALAGARENLAAQAATISTRVRQQAGSARAGIRAEVTQAVQRINTGLTSLLSEVTSTVSTTHSLIDAHLATRKLEATMTGITSQQTITGIFSGHRTNVQTTVQRNIDAAEQLRRDKAEEVRRRNRDDIRAAYIKGGAKLRSYPGTNRGSYIGGACFDVAEGVANKMREQEPELISAINENTAPLPQYFREQGAKALEGFDVNLPQILASVDTGVVQARTDQDQRGREAHARLNFVADRTRVELGTLAGEATAQAIAFGPQLEAQLDRELRNVLRAIAAAPRDVMNRIAPPIEEAIVLMRTGEDPNVEAARELAGGLIGFLDESTASTVGTMERAAQASQERFQGMRSSARQAMHAQVERSNKVWDGARTGFPTTTSTMLSNFDAGFAGVVTALRNVLTETERSIRDQLAPIISQLDGGLRAVTNDASGKIDGRINEGMAKNAEALRDLDGQMREAASQAAWEWDHPVLSSIETGLQFVAGLIAGILVVLALVAVFLLVGWAIAAALGVSMLTAGLIMLAGMAAIAIGFSFGARLAAGQGIGEAFVGAVGDFARGVPGMLYDMTGIPKLRRAFSDERMTPFERGKLIGEGGTELVFAIFMVRGAAKGIATSFRRLPAFRPPAVPPRATVMPELAAPRAPTAPVSAPRPVVEPVGTPRTAPEAPRIGFGREGIREIQPRPPNAPTQPEPRIGFGREGVRQAQPRPPEAIPQSEPRIGFGREGVRQAQPRPPEAIPQSEPRIGFGREGVRQAQPRPPEAVPQSEPRIGFGREGVRQAQPRPPVSQAPEGASSLDLRGRVIEAGQPGGRGPAASGGPVRAGGRAAGEVRASAEPAGPTRPAGEPARPAGEPVRTGEPRASSGANEPAATEPRPVEPELHQRGNRPRPGERSTGREEWRQQHRQQRAESRPGLSNRGRRPGPGERQTTREEWRAQQSRERWRRGVERDVNEAFGNERVQPGRRTGGTSDPRIDGSRIPGEPPRRMDIEDLPRESGETARQAVARVRRVIGRRLSDYPDLERLWNLARQRVLRNRTLDETNYEDLYNKTRDAFWRRVRTDANARRILNDAGFDPPAPGGRAPRLRGLDPSIPREEGTISLDHLAEKAQGNNWQRALDADNLQMEFSRPNTQREIIQMRHPTMRAASE